MQYLAAIILGLVITPYLLLAIAGGVLFVGFLAFTVTLVLLILRQVWYILVGKVR